VNEIEWSNQESFFGRMCLFELGFEGVYGDKFAERKNSQL